MARSRPRARSRRQGPRRWSDLLGPPRVLVYVAPPAQDSHPRRPEQEPGKGGGSPAPECADGICRCEAVNVGAWVMPMASGRIRPCVLLTPGCFNPDSDAGQRLLGRVGVSPGSLDQVVQAMVHMVSETAATVAFAQVSVGPLQVPPLWTKLAREDMEVGLLVGTAPGEDDGSIYGYLDRHEEQLAGGLIPVSNEKVDGQ